MLLIRTPYQTPFLPKCRPAATHQVVHVGPGEHVRLHVGVLVQQGVEQQRGLVGPLLLAQRRVQTVEIDLEGVRLLRGQRRRVCGGGVGERRRNTLRLGRTHCTFEIQRQTPDSCLPCVFLKQVMACR